MLAAAGLYQLIHHVLSGEEVRLSKPRPEVYRYAVQAAGVDPSELALVAAHPWDVHGAKVADLAAGYVSRGRPFPPALRAPDVTGETLLDVARELTRV